MHVPVSSASVMPMREEGEHIETTTRRTGIGMVFLLISLLILLISCLAGRRVATAISEMPGAEGMFWARDVMCVALASVLTCLAIEVWNDQMGQVAFMYIQHEFLVVFVIMSICYLVAFRSGVLMALASVVGALIGIAEHYVLQFRGTPIIPTDVSPSAFGTAGEVANGYDFAPDEVILTTLAFGALAVAVSMLVRRPKGHAGVHLVGDSVRDIRDAFMGAKDSHATTGAHSPSEQAEGKEGNATDCEKPEEVDREVTEDAEADEMDERVEVLPDEDEEDTDRELSLVAIKDEITVIGSESHDDGADDEPHLRKADSSGRMTRPKGKRGKSSPKHLRDDGKSSTGKVTFRRVASLMNPLLTIIVAVALVAGGTFLWEFDYKENFPDMFTDWWRIAASYRAQGTIPTFSYLFQTTKVKEPDGWSEKKAQADYDELVAAYVPTTEEDGVTRGAPAGTDMPDIIGIMNESHCDMTFYGCLELPVEAAPRFMRTDAPEGIVESGRARVSVFGGQTANSEYEFLTGDSLLALGKSAMPFAQYNLSEVPSLPRQLAEMGYGTYAVHPCVPGNWNRTLRYPELGFDEFLSLEDFHEAKLDSTFHDMISDRMCYAMTRKILDEREDSGKPTFIWNVTMQNHGGYDMNNIPEESVVDYDLSMLDDTLADQVREYMSCAEESNKAVLDFLAELDERERPTIVVFYGDHQPVCNTPVVDEMYPDLDSDAIGALKFQTDYFIWENKAMREKSDQSKGEEGDADDAAEADADAEDTEQPAKQPAKEEPHDGDGEEPAGEDAPVDYRPRDEIGVNMLGARLMERIGYPLTDFQKAVLSIRTEARSTCLVGMVQASDYAWLSMDDKEPPEPLRKLRDIDWLVVDRKIAFS